MKEAVLQRIKSIVKAKARSKNDFAIKLSMGQTTVNNYVNGDRAISLDFILHILATFPDISAEWLLRGEGAMYRTQAPYSQDITLENTNVIQHGHNNITASKDVTIQDCENRDLIIQRLLDQNQQLLEMIKQNNAH